MITVITLMCHRQFVVHNPGISPETYKHFGWLKLNVKTMHPKDSLFVINGHISCYKREYVQRHFSKTRPSFDSLYSEY